VTRPGATAADELRAIPVPRSASAGVRKSMQGNRRTGTAPELRLRSALHAEGMRFRVDYRIETSTGPVRPDIAFTRRKVAVFVDGCFWHGCPEHGVSPKTNTSYWEPKLRRNGERDGRDSAMLRDAG
jgi:DNA mismatch endonuclease (patch repair protein)